MLVQCRGNGGVRADGRMCRGITQARGAMRRRFRVSKSSGRSLTGESGSLWRTVRRWRRRPVLPALRRDATERAEESDANSSSVSEDPQTSSGAAAGRAGMCWGKQNVGRVGMETGSEGLLERRVRWWWNVGEMGDDCGLLRRRNVEMGVLAMRSASSDSFLSRRALSDMLDVRCAMPRNGDDGRGDDESA